MFLLYLYLLYLLYLSEFSEAGVQGEGERMSACGELATETFREPASLTFGLSGPFNPFTSPTRSLQSTRPPPTSAHFLYLPLGARCCARNLCRTFPHKLNPEFKLFKLSDPGSNLFTSFESWIQPFNFVGSCIQHFSMNFRFNFFGYMKLRILLPHLSSRKDIKGQGRITLQAFKLALAFLKENALKQDSGRAHSGWRRSGVPGLGAEWCRCKHAAESPKSVSLMWPSLDISRLSGLTSLWIIPCVTRSNHGSVS